MAGNLWGEGPRGGIFGARVDSRARRRIEEAFKAAEAMQEPSKALIHARNLRDRELSAEPGFLENVASLGPRAVGGAQKMWQMAPAAAGALWEDPLGTIDRAGRAGQAATDAIVRAVPQPFARFNDPRFDQIENAADLTGSVMLGSAAIPAEANALRMGIRAYHGSPHDFERFDASKIGTGEGAQAYGHGIYLAEAEPVAKAYKGAGPASRAQYDEINNRMSELARVMGADAVPGRGRVFKSDVGRKAAEEYDALMQKRENLGHMYEVDIAAEPEQFLDWDKPLAEQSPQVREAMEKAGYSASQGLPPQYSTVGYTAGRELQKPSETALLREAGIPGIRYLDQGSRGNIANLPKNPMTDEARKWLEANGNDADAAVKAFQQNQRDTGYKDWSSTERDEIVDVIRKSVQRQTSNYVVFDDKLISILKKYGLPISTAGLAALTQLHPEEAKAAQRKDKK